MNTHISLAEYINHTKSNTLQIQNIKKVSSSPTKTPSLEINSDDIKDEFESAKKQNGQIEKLADKIKSALKIGYSSKKIEQSISELNSGKKTKQDVEKEIKNYRRSQENAAQTIGDIASITVAGLVFFALHKNLTKGKSIIQINEKVLKNKLGSFLSKTEDTSLNSAIKNTLSKLKKTETQNKIYDIITNKKTVNLVSALPAMLVGGFIKSTLLKLNRIGTLQYKAEYDKEKMSKDEIKQIKKTNKKAKRNADFRNKITGNINGLTIPIVGILGPIGVPIYIVINSLSKYFIGTREDKGEKTPTLFLDNLSTSKILNIMGAGLIAIPLIRNGKIAKELEQNAQKVAKELKNLKLPVDKTIKGPYEELQEILFNNKAISSIMTSHIDDTEKIQLLSKENIFALKFKQISQDGSSLTQALREKCPQTWALDDAQKEIDRVFGKNTYKLRQCVGSGTVAQTFVAQDSNGKNVCIKMLHKGINKEKITKDKEAFIAMINSSTRAQEEKDYLIKNIENISRGIEAEVDLRNEMESAKKLAQTIKKANVVKPIEVKDNIYVMERAEGISLSDFNEFGKKIRMARWDVDYYGSLDTMDSYDKIRYEDAKKQLEELTAQFKTKVGIDIDFQDLTKEETIKMLKQYQDILTEQFSKAEAQGKIIHGDIHPGNIFIDVKKLKEGKGCFTLIDTGNVIEQTKEQSIRFMNLTNYIKNADIDNIVNFVLDGAILPDDMNKSKAAEILRTELQKAFFDKQTGIPLLTNDTLLNLTDNIMKKVGIIPSSTQGNLLKAKKSSSNSLSELYNAYLDKFGARFDDYDDLSVVQKTTMMTKAIAELTKDITALQTRNKFRNMMQERANLLKLPLSERLKLKKSPNTPKPNSEEALTYFLKQYKSNFDINKLMGNFSELAS